MVLNEKIRNRERWHFAREAKLLLSDIDMSK
jgi:hypothetical protein